MSDRRVILLTSAGSGVGVAVQEAAASSNCDYMIVGTSSTPVVLRTGGTALNCPETARREEFQSRIALLAAGLRRCLLVPGRDEDAAALTLIAAELSSRGATLTSGPASAVTAAFDKNETARLLGRHGLPVAATAADLTDAAELARDRGWPLVLKPRRGSASRGVRLVSDETALRASFRPGIDIAQEFLAVGQSDRRSWDDELASQQVGEYSLQILIDRRGREIGHFCSRNALVDGVPRLVETVSDGQIGALLTQVREALRQESAWGAWNFQGRRRADGEIVIFEINARFTGLTGLRAHLGFNEVDMLYDCLVLEREPAPPPCVTAGRVIDATTMRQAHAGLDGRVATG